MAANEKEDDAETVVVVVVVDDSHIQWPLTIYMRMEKCNRV